jgi:hypothetical protein
MFVFNQKGEVQVREVSERPEIVSFQTINAATGNATSLMKPSPTQAWQSVRVNHLVVVTPLTTPDDYPQIKPHSA